MTDRANADRRDLVAQIKNRALIYMEIFDVLSAEVGAARPRPCSPRRSSARLAAGKSLARHAPDDLEG